MNSEFDRSLFATVLVGLALLLSLTTAARFPTALRPWHADVSTISTSGSIAESLLTSQH
jgi:hypothetical protein